MITGSYYCHANTAFLTSIWASVYTAVSFAVSFLIPFSLVVHNYTRIGRALFKNLKENIHLQEGINTQ